MDFGRRLGEWAIGTAYFVGFCRWRRGSWAIQFTRPEWPTESEWKLLPLTFFGTLWLLALGEELFFRGCCSNGWGSGLKNEWAGLALTSVVFGAVHLWYRDFPNWKLAVLAVLAGRFTGSRSVRAGDTSVDGDACVDRDHVEDVF